MKSRLFGFAVVALAVVTASVLPMVMADGGAQHQVQQATPIKLGTSGGNVNNISNAFCCSGTLGALVTKNSTRFILSNNHVLADSDTGVIGDDISHPGLIDVGCNRNNAIVVADLFQAVPLGTGNVDAAIATVVGNTVDSSGAILDIGVPASTPAAINSDTIGDTVAKSGRTTGMTCGAVTSIDTDVKVQYQQGCNKGKKFFVTYTNQLVVGGSSFSAGGDSGSLIVTAETAQPIALLYAGSSTTTIGNRIGDVTAALEVSFVGGGTHAVSCPSGGGGGGKGPSAGQRQLPEQAAYGFDRAMRAKQSHAQRLLQDPGIMGVGVGMSENDASDAVVVIFVEEGRAHGQLPSELDGVPVRIVRTDTIRAYGWNEKLQPAACTAGGK